MRRLGYSLLGIGILLLVYGQFFAVSYYPVGRRFKTAGVVFALAAAPLFHRAAWRDYREALRRGGYCPACGYDLRASPERCPECGRATSAAR